MARNASVLEDAHVDVVACHEKAPSSHEWGGALLASVVVCGHRARTDVADGAHRLDGHDEPIASHDEGKERKPMLAMTAAVVLPASSEGASAVTRRSS